MAKDLEITIRISWWRLLKLRIAMFLFHHEFKIFSHYIKGELHGDLFDKWISLK